MLQSRLAGQRFWQRRQGRYRGDDIRHARCRLWYLPNHSEGLRRLEGVPFVPKLAALPPPSRPQGSSPMPAQIRYRSRRYNTGGSLFLLVPTTSTGEPFPHHHRRLGHVRLYGYEAHRRRSRPRGREERTKKNISTSS